MTKIKKPLTS